MKFRHKIPLIEAIRFDGSHESVNSISIMARCVIGSEYYEKLHEDYQKVDRITHKNLDGIEVYALPGDWAIVHGNARAGEMEFMSDEAFVHLYESVDIDEADLEYWISTAFAGHGMAIRREDDPPIPGEPLMSMAVAKDLVRKAVRSMR